MVKGCPVSQARHKSFGHCVWSEEPGPQGSSLRSQLDSAAVMTKPTAEVGPRALSSVLGVGSG